MKREGKLMKNKDELRSPMYVVDSPCCNVDYLNCCIASANKGAACQRSLECFLERLLIAMHDTKTQSI